jgi:protein tyrosine/serine phosphatase
MDRHLNKIIAMERIVTVAAILLLLASCGHVQSASKQQETSRIVKVDEGIYRGPRLDDLSELRSLKIHTILNLEDNLEAVHKESETAKQLGIVMISIPMSEIFRPKPADLLQAVKILEDRGPNAIYVHCLHGRDRTGFVVAAYKMIHYGWPVEKAYQEAVNNGHNRWFYDRILVWKESLREIIQTRKTYG